LKTLCLEYCTFGETKPSFFNLKLFRFLKGNISIFLFVVPSLSFPDFQQMEIVLSFLDSISEVFIFLKGDCFIFSWIHLFHISKGRSLVFQKLMSRQSTCYRAHEGNSLQHCLPESRLLEADNPSWSHFRPPSSQTRHQPVVEGSAGEVSDPPLSTLPGRPCLPI